MASRAPLNRFRVLLVLPAIVALTAGVLSGLARLGLPISLPFARLLGVHGALMVGGFFGTLIGLERAVALARGWPYLAPAASGLAALCLVTAPASALGPWLMGGGALVMTLACADVWRRQREAHLATLAAAAFAWLAGNAVWLYTGAIVPAVPLWAAFLILTIAGERLELSRFVPTPRPARRLFAGIVLLLLGSAMVHAATGEALRGYALALLLLAAWLLRFDIARRTVKTAGLTRYMAICLLSGYGWLGVSALLGLTGALYAGSPLRDAALHALLLGFVFAMVCGHAPVIGPALTRLKMRWHRGFYLPLLLLHGTLLLRVASAWHGGLAWRQWGAIGNALVLAVFMATLLESFWAARRPASRLRSKAT
ncbi:hypothetical protein [Paludibacterium purpuratum]|uniref:NnrS family protein n=1 Tax=Paludibacterium purpuratum TaxID=1144873 RepID=A0A4R7AUH5_9NEIS|nr:hypothetical protein [Paludibacterium purpuratum]TDR70617.1 hypothetical protein DFP86_1229 [Paludibacterium purpuratum]